MHSAKQYASRFGVALTIFLIAGAAWAQQGPAPTVVNPQPAQFQTMPNIPACGKIAVLDGNPETGAAVLLVRLSAGCSVPWHWHTPDERVMMRSGIGKVEPKGEKGQRLVPGGFLFMPSHHVHRFTCVGPCELFISSSGAFDLHYVDESGNEISLEQAVAAAGKSAAAKAAAAPHR